MKRYDFSYCTVCGEDAQNANLNPHGEWVRYEDYMRIAVAEARRLNVVADQLDEAREVAAKLLHYIKNGEQTMDAEVFVKAAEWLLDMEEDK